MKSVFIFALLVLMEMLRVSLLAMMEKQDGAWIIGAGFLVFNVAVIYQLLIILEVLQGFSGIFEFVYIYGILALLVSMSVYLARDFARINKGLEQANRQLEGYSESLEQKVEERTREVNEKNVELEETLHQLKETQSRLVMQEKLASLGNLVAGIAHEMNTPVGAMSSMHDTLIRAVDRLKEALGGASSGDNRTIQSLFDVIANANRVIATGTERVTVVVRSLKSFSRLDEAEYQVVDIHEGIDSALTLLQTRMKDDIVAIRNYADLKPLYCSPSQLNQVFMSLLRNAIQAIEGKGEIRIKTFCDDREVYIQISDTGAGIPPEQLEHIFDFGFRTADSRVEMGLGLAMEYTIVQEHQGEI